MLHDQLFSGGMPPDPLGPLRGSWVAYYLVSTCKADMTILFLFVKVCGVVDLMFKCHIKCYMHYRLKAASGELSRKRMRPSLWVDLTGEPPLFILSHIYFWTRYYVTKIPYITSAWVFYFNYPFHTQASAKLAPETLFVYIFFQKTKLTALFLLPKMDSYPKLGEADPGGLGACPQ
jgi:hypothetical protein